MSQFPPPGSIVATIGVFFDRNYIVPIGFEPAVVAAAGHVPGCALGGRTAIVSAVVGRAVQERCGRWHLGAIGAVWAGVDAHRRGQNLGSLAGDRRWVGGVLPAGGGGARD